MTFRKLMLTAAIAIAPALLLGQEQTQSQPSNQGGLDPATIGKPLADSWPSYSGDYTGRRYSTLTQVTQTTVKNLSLAWVGRVSGPPSPAGGGGGFGGFGGGRGGGGGAAPLIIGGGRADDWGGGGGGTGKRGGPFGDGGVFPCGPPHLWGPHPRGR